MPEERDALLLAYRKGLMSLGRDSRFQNTVLTNEGIEEVSDILLTQLNVADYFDRQIYSTAACSHFTILTEDERLHELFKKSGDLPKPKQIIKWKNLLIEKK